MRTRDDVGTVDRDHLGAEVALADASERREDLVEREDQVEVAPPHGSGAQAPECLAPPRPQEVVLRVG